MQKRAEKNHYQSIVFVCVSNNHGDAVDRLLVFYGKTTTRKIANIVECFLANIFVPRRRSCVGFFNTRLRIRTVTFTFLCNDLFSDLDLSFFSSP